MKNSIAVTPGHTLIHWSHAGQPVIFPLSHNDRGEERGGIPLCVPMFSVQQRPVAGCNLPLHGLLMHSDHGEVAHDQDSDTLTITSHFSATKSFNWNHTVVTQITETADSLSYHVTVSRAPDCPNPGQMPISLGFHPYFATHGSDFSFSIGDQKVSNKTLPSNIIDSMFVSQRENASVVLQTNTHIITMESTGFDEYCIWTDDIEKYICIEPIWQMREFGLPQTGLQPGEEKVVTVHLSVEQNT